MEGFHRTKASRSRFVVALWILLLLGGGLLALQSAAVASGIVFAIVILVSIYSMRKAFSNELKALDAAGLLVGGRPRRKDRS